LLSPRLQLGPQLAQPLLTLAGELLKLDQLLLDVVQVGGQVSPQLSCRAADRGHGIHDPLLDPDQLGQLRRPGRIAPSGLRLEQCDVVLDPLQVTLADTAGQGRQDRSQPDRPQA